MSYADYGYYTDSCGGSIIPEADFPFYSAKASDRINAVTFGRLEEGVPEEFSDKVKRCCCELAERIYSLEKSGRVSAESGAVASESNSRYSVTYRSPAEASAALLHGESAGLEDVCGSVIRLHLGNTGLLYRGVYE